MLKAPYKIRSPHRPIADVGEPVWGNGCERRGCLKESIGGFILCSDGVTREFCREHGEAEHAVRPLRPD